MRNKLIFSVHKENIHQNKDIIGKIGSNEILNEITTKISITHTCF